MRVTGVRGATLVLAVLVCLSSSLCWAFPDQPADTNLSKDQIKQFLLTAKVIKSKQSSIGITHPFRLTLTDGTITHDASFQAVDEHKSMEELASGRMELNFVDSYKYNIAAYALAELLGIDDMIPVYVERKWDGNKGSLSWWLPIKMDEAERAKQKIEVPDSDAWNKQMYKVRVFDQLVYDTDANLTNVLIGTDWKVYRVDFTRAFRTFKRLDRPNDLVRCDRQLLAKLKALDRSQLMTQTKGYLNKSEVDAVMARRDKIVEHFDKLIAKEGENQVLY
ncbi:MAG TPA: hypothetical protein VL155_02720 [Terriglobales bacterium]|jgi:hypothetical protein|nr:hypothetical protein [Terriglobales bacterium]